MIENVNENEFVDRFKKLDRNENFSYEGLIALFEYFEQLEEDLNEQIEFNCIAICCEYSEYENINDFKKGYGEKFQTLEDIKDNTIVIEIENSNRFIIQNF